MTDATSAEALAEKLEARAEYWEGKCNRLTYGACQTRACLVRGGWKRGDPVNYDVATCETREACITDTTAASLLRSQAARIEADAKRIEEMERALEPFADEAEGFDERYRDETVVPLFSFTYGDLRAARAARKAQP